MADIEEILKERDKNYGSFADHAIIAQTLKEVLQGKVDMVPTNWKKLAEDQKEALEMIAHKIARILNGNPDYADSWVDIAGYAKLIAARLTLKDN